ncbi:MAG: polysaccharide biosynthesis protein [Oscillospiraceae bacterium]|nr:polysaccharide biosynthesis protein [Oscillospiraceae bacterium]
MKIERVKNAKKNITAGLILKIHQMLIPFLMRTAMIYFMGVEYLGLHSLFSSILHILNLAELGVGSAMVFSMYKPIARDDGATICALMRLYRKYYRLIGLLIGAVGLALTPVIPNLISGEIPAELSIYVLYLLNLGSTVLTYWLFAYKNCLLQAHQRTDVSSVITLITNSLQYVLQLIVLLVFKSYYLYAITSMVTQAINNVCTAVVVTKMYPDYKPSGSLSKAETKKINGRIRDLFTGKLGGVILSSSDTVVISSFLGLTVLAIYQNYYFMQTCIIGMIEIALTSVVAGLGNSFVTETKQTNFENLEKFTFIFLWLTGVCTCCFLGMYQPFMEVWVGKELMLDFSAVICFAIYFFVYTYFRFVNVYKDAAGLWHIDRFRPLVGAAVNLVLNLLCVRRFGIYGVILSTVLAIVLVSMPWLFRNLFTGFFELSRLKGYLKQVLLFAGAVLLAGVLVCMICAWIKAGPWLRLVLNGLVCVTVPNIVFYLVFRKNRLYALSVRFVVHMAKQKMGKG